MLCIYLMSCLLATAAAEEGDPDCSRGRWF